MSTIPPEGGRDQPLRESQGARLSEEEAKLVAKLLSDPTYFPIEFRTWLKNYIEGSGITLPASQIRGGGAGLKIGLPAGVILAYAATTLPPDVALCDGTEVSRTDFKLLFDIIGTTWGAGNGTTTFNLPDLRDRALYGVGGAVGMAQTDGAALGQRGGPDHHHYFQDTQPFEAYGDTEYYGDHSHNLDGQTGAFFNINAGQTADVRAYLEPRGNTYTHGSGGHYHAVTVSGEIQVGGDTSGGSAQDHPSFAGIMYVITTGR